MTAQILNFRDYQSKAAIERAHKALEDHLNREAISIANMAFPSVFGFADPPCEYLAPTQDPA